MEDVKAFLIFTLTSFSILFSSTTLQADGLTSIESPCNKAGIFSKGKLLPNQRLKCVVYPIKLDQTCKSRSSFGAMLEDSSTNNYLRMDIFQQDTSSFSSSLLEIIDKSVDNSYIFNSFTLTLSELPLIIFGFENVKGNISYFSGIAEDTSTVKFKNYGGTIKGERYKLYIRGASINFNCKVLEIE